MQKLWQKFDGYIHSIYFEKDYRNYYERGGNTRYFVNLPILMFWGVMGLFLKLFRLR